eukprot:c26891_g1_i1 orf=370-2355(-)
MRVGRLVSVNVTMQVLQSNHVGSAIVEAAHKVNATSVILGSSCNFFSVQWHLHAIGKYCAKRLSSYSKVMIVCRGKLVTKRSGSAKGRNHTLRMLFTSEQAENHKWAGQDHLKRSSSPDCLTEGCSFRTDSSLNTSVSLQHVADLPSQEACSLVSKCLPEKEHSMTDESTSSDMSCCSEGSGSYYQGSPNSVLQKYRNHRYTKNMPFPKKYYCNNQTSISNFDYTKSPLIKTDPCSEVRTVQGLYKSSETVIENRTIPEVVKEENQEENASVDIVFQFVKSKLRMEEIGRPDSDALIAQTDGTLCWSFLEVNDLQHKYLIKPVLQKTDLESHCFLGERFLYMDLQLATRNFSNDNLVGRGGSSSVYKGRLDDGRLVAVKELSNSAQGEKEFIMEIAVIAGVQHQNLVQYIGYCMESFHRLLVFDFVPNGNLLQRLYGDPGKPAMNWDQRQKVALGAARGLEYLHFSLSQCIIHRDIKSSNILLTEEDDAQVSDFGLSKFTYDACTDIPCSGLVGTFGYMAPEYFLYGTVDEKTDVHAFGVVLLEIISGRLPVDTSLSRMEESLVQWARFLEREGMMYKLVDKRLQNVNVHQLKRMMYTAFLCIKELPQDRPDMRRVIRLLDSTFECSEPLLATSCSPDIENMQKMYNVILSTESKDGKSKR